MSALDRLVAHNRRFVNCGSPESVKTFPRGTVGRMYEDIQPRRPQQEKSALDLEPSIQVHPSNNVQVRQCRDFRNFAFRV